MTGLLNFNDAIRRVLSGPDLCAFAYYPTVRRNQIVGGTGFTIRRDDDGDSLSWLVEGEAGRFNVSEGTCDVIWPEDFEEGDMAAIWGVDPRSLIYKVCSETVALDAIGMSPVSICRRENIRIVGSAMPGRSRWVMPAPPAPGRRYGMN